MNSSKRLHFSVLETIEGSPELITLQFDWASFTLNKFNEGVRYGGCSFAEFKEVQGEATSASLVVLRTSGEPFRFTALCNYDWRKIFKLIKIIADNSHEVISKSTNNIEQCCEKMRPKIRMRTQKVSSKGSKQEGATLDAVQSTLKSTLGTLGRKKKPTGSDKAHKKPINWLVMTERQLYCLEEDTMGCVPLRVFALKELEITEIDDRGFSFNVKGSKYQFTCEGNNLDDRSMFLRAKDKALQTKKKEARSIGLRVDQLQMLYRTSFERDNAEHVALLRRLWDASKLEEGGGQRYDFQLRCNRWKDLGFQRDDPVSDLRATGVLGLHNLVYFAETYSSLFLQMARSQQQSSEMEYPFATAAINIAYLLIEMLGLQKEDDWIPRMQTHPIMFYHPSAWQELFSIVFRLFDHKWNIMLVGYMGFQKVIESTRESVEDLLNRKSIGDTPAIVDMLGILLEDLSSFKSSSDKRKERASYKFTVPENFGTVSGVESKMSSASGSKGSSSPSPSDSQSSLVNSNSNSNSQPESWAWVKPSRSASSLKVKEEEEENNNSSDVNDEEDDKDKKKSSARKSFFRK